MSLCQCVCVSLCVHVRECVCVTPCHEMTLSVISHPDSSRSTVILAAITVTALGTLDAITVYATWL